MTHESRPMPIEELEAGFVMPNGFEPFKGLASATLRLMSFVESVCGVVVVEGWFRG